MGQLGIVQLHSHPEVVLHGPHDAVFQGKRHVLRLGEPDERQKQNRQSYDQYQNQL